MSHRRDIDNAPSSSLQGLHKQLVNDSFAFLTRSAISLALSVDSMEQPPTSPDQFIVSLPSSSQRIAIPRSSHTFQEAAGSSSAKGKGIARPADIPARVADDAQLDIFSMSYDEDHAPLTPDNNVRQSSDQMFDEMDQDIPFVNKGKGKDLPPSLPPLTFSPTHFDYDEIYQSPTLSTSEPGPSSFGSIYTIATGRDPGPIDTPLEPRPREIIPVLTRMPSRRRSLSNLSTHSTRSLTASISRIKVKFGSPKSAGGLARRLFMKDGDGRRPPSSPSSAPSSPMPGATLRETEGVDFDLGGTGGCFAPWRRDSKFRSRENGPYPNLNIDGVIGEGAPIYFPIYQDARAEWRGKGRSNSDPLPLPHAFDVIPPSTADVFTPLPSPTPRNTFDTQLPRELRLRIFGCLVQIHEVDHARREREGRWTAIKASKHRWVGRDQGVRELVRLSRVCKTWLALVFDGQLWSQLDLKSFPKVPASQIMQIADSAGPFIRAIDFVGHGHLQSSTLENLSTRLALARDVVRGISITRLTSVNLQGCSSLSTFSLHYLLRRCPELLTLNVKGLGAVTNETCELLHEYCPHIVSLDMSRCRNLTGAGIRTLASFTMKDGHLLDITELRLSGMKGITDSVMDALGKAAPYLEVLDLSHCRDLHNSSLDAFVSCPDDYPESQSVLLSAREAGRDPNHGGRYRRRVTRLRHLSLSSCLLLTDIACAHLAHAMPRLEFLELAGIGGDIKDDGLVLLLETLPNLRKLDLEDATDITDAVLEAITPPPPTEDPGRGPHPGPVPGHALEHVVVSYAVQLSNEAFLALIRSCPRLRVLEADSTRMSGVVVKEFTARAKEREMLDASVIAVDCRSVGEGTVKELSGSTRPRLGWRAYEARRLAYLDGRDDEILGVGQDECDPRRVVLKTFYSWQTVDAVAAARQKRRKNRREANGSGSSGVDDFMTGRSRWWSPGGRRSPGANSPSLLDMNNDRDGCIIM
ncbi:RNI-like protein [Artomyces pyxidatus]|uniref:RNI-like protein n=1 Tax=Artomyces pyxidatus TaxID=48021 RepID=A0ACB8TI41_9AGAM|nr:RNI-like protein [Artomyces pyxidatus]